MFLLVAGLVLFLSVHSIRIIADEKRSAFINSRGEGAFKVAYSLASLLGLVLLLVGYGQTRLTAQFLWHPPALMSLIAALLMLFSFVLLAAAYVPHNRIKLKLGHPMLLAVKIWAFAHLLANGRWSEVVMFGSFLAWAVINYIISRKRDRLSDTTEIASANANARADIIVVIVGVAAWLIFAMWAHVRLIGVSPFGA